MSENEPVWDAPPEQEFQRSKWRPYVELVKKNQGRWLRIGVFTQGSSPPYNAKKWIEANYPNPEIEVKVARISETEVGAWIRWRTPEQLRAGNGG